MIPKSGNRFSEKIMPTKQITDESDSTQLNQTLDAPAGIASCLNAEMRRRPPRAIGGSGGSRAGPSFSGVPRRSDSPCLVYLWQFKGMRSIIHSFSRLWHCLSSRFRARGECSYRCINEQPVPPNPAIDAEPRTPARPGLLCVAPRGVARSGWMRWLDSAVDLVRRVSEPKHAGVEHRIVVSPQHLKV